MKFGIGIPTCREGRDYPADFSGPEEMIELSQMAERLDIDYVWGDDHIAPNEALMKQDARPPAFYETLLSFAYVAAATKKVRLGVGVLVMIWRDPILVAKQAATLDVISKGRLTLGVGVGGGRAEFEAVQPRLAKNAHRGRLLDEQIEVIHKLFTEDNVTHKGEYFEFQDLSLYPKPAQNPFPFYITAFSKDTPEGLRRMAKYARLCSVNPTEESVKGRIESLKPYMEEVGRDISEVELTTLPTAAIGRTHKEAVEQLQKSRLFLRYKGQSLEQVEAENFVGTPTEIADKVARLEGVGLGQCAPQRLAANTYEELKEQVELFGEVVKQFK